MASVTTLGTPIESVVVTASALAQWHDGRPVLVTVGGPPDLPVTLCVLDCADGEVLAVHEIATMTRAHHVTASGSTAWISSWSGANLYRYDLVEDEITDLGMPLPGQVIIASTTLAPGAHGGQDVLYGGTFPGGRIFGWDLGRDTVNDLGRLDRTEDMVRAVSWDGSGLWCGTEAHGRLHRWDPATGLRTSVLLPPDLGPVTGIDDLAVRRRKLFVHTIPSQSCLVLDLDTLSWQSPIPYRVARGVTQPDAADRVHLVGLDERRVVHHCLDSGQTWLADDVLPDGVSHLPHSGAHLVEAPEGDQVVLGIDAYGSLWHHRLDNDRCDPVESQIPPRGTTIRALGVGPEGEILVGGSVARTTFARYRDGDEGFCRVSGGPGSRIDAFATVAQRILFSHYQDGSVYEFDTARDWVGPPDNPRCLFRLLESHRQERIFALLAREQDVLVGSTGARGVADGRLLRWQLESEELIDLGTPIPGHSVTTLVELGGDAVLLGTSVQVLGDDDHDTSAAVALVDPSNGTVIWSQVPQPGARAVSALTRTRDGSVWGLTDRGHVFRLDPQTRAVRDLVKVGPVGGLWGMGSLHPYRSWLVGATGSGTVFTIDTRTHQVQYLGLGEHALPAPDGHLYWADADQLVRLSLDDLTSTPSLKEIP